MNNDKKIRYDLILGSRRLSNYLWASITFLGGSGFFITGLSSYLQKEILPFIKIDSISFIPQGIVMTFYGMIGILISIFLVVNIALNIGGGYNKYDKNLDKIEIFRLGFPTKDQRQIPLTRIGEPLLLSSIEEEAVNLSMYLNVPLES